jgi:hypothetical protein
MIFSPLKIEEIKLSTCIHDVGVYTVPVYVKRKYFFFFIPPPPRSTAGTVAKFDPLYGKFQIEWAAPI